MDLPVRAETVIFALAVAVLGWAFLDLPPVERAVATGAAVAVFVAASAAIERWRRQYLAEHLSDEDDGTE